MISGPSRYQNVASNFGKDAEDILIKLDALGFVPGLSFGKESRVFNLSKTFYLVKTSVYLSVFQFLFLEEKLQI